MAIRIFKLLPVETWLIVKENFGNCNAREMHEEVDNSTSLRMEEWFINDGHKSPWAWSIGLQLDLKGDMDAMMAARVPGCGAVGLDLKVDKDSDRYAGFQMEEEFVNLS